MLKIWGRNTSTNVQKVMWAIGELGLPHERIDVGGAFGKNNEPAYLAMNPNGAGADAGGGGRLHLVGIELDRALSRGQARRRHARARGPARRGRSASRWMDWQLSVTGPAITPVFWGLIRTPPEKRDRSRDRRRQGQDHRGDADARRAARQDRVSSPATRSPIGDIPVGIMAYRYRAAHSGPARKLAHLERWYAGDLERARRFKEQVARCR